MKIVYTASVAHEPRASAGHAVHINQVVGRLRGRGHRVVLMACLPEGGHELTAPQGSADGGGDTVFVGRRPSGPLGLLAFNARFALRILALPKPRADVLYVRFGHWQFSPPLLAKRLGIPVVVEVNGVPDADRNLGRFHRALIGRVLRAADRLVITSPVMKQHFAERFGVDPGRCEVIANGVDIDTYRPRPEAPRRFLPAERPVVGYVGTLAEYWGLDLLWRSAPDLVRRFPDLLFAVAGSGPMGEALRTEFAARGLEDHLRLLGALSYKDAAQLMAECDALAAPLRPVPRNEMSSPIKVYHYLASGTPVVASRMAVMEQFGGSGIGFFEPESEEDFVRAVGRALGVSSEEKNALAWRQHDFIRRRFTWDHTVDRIETVLRELAGEH